MAVSTDIAVSNDVTKTACGHSIVTWLHAHID